MQCAHEQKQSSQVQVSSSLHRLALQNPGISHSFHLLVVFLLVTHTINLKIETLLLLSLQKKVNPPGNSSTINFKWLLINLNYPPLNACMCQNLWFPPIWNNWDKIRLLTSGLRYDEGKIKQK